MELELNRLDKETSYPYAVHHEAKHLTYVIALRSRDHGHTVSMQGYQRAGEGLETLGRWTELQGERGRGTAGVCRFTSSDLKF